MCCGQKRESFTRTTGTVYETSEPTPVGPPPGTVFFQYLGGTALTVLGPVTRRRYRFGWPGAQVAVSNKDAPLLVSGVPNLRQVAIGEEQT